MLKGTYDKSVGCVKGETNLQGKGGKQQILGVFTPGSQVEGSLMQKPVREQQCIPRSRICKAGKGGEIGEGG